MGDFCMPSLGADMKAGILVAWRVRPGGRVRHGDIIAEVETDKGLFEVEVFEDGIVDRLLVQPGRDRIPVSTVLATIRAEGAPSEIPIAETEKAVSERVMASPAARKRAAELQIDLTTLQGTGPQGAITLADVEQAGPGEKQAGKAVAEPAAKKPAAEFQAGMRRAIAAAMSRSNREIPHYYLETDIDMSRALAWLQEENRKRSIKERLLPAVLLIKAVARALEKVPELNGHWIDERLQTKKEAHIGFAIALRQGGLITPALHDVNRKSLDQLMTALGDLIGRTRAGRLRASEMTDATITVTSLGDLGVGKVFGVIYPPQVALVGFGRIAERPWAENGMLGVRPILTATLAADHRATDGSRGARFLEALDRSLQDPEKL
jgi:pyruvate dehydrogenase E2 component (dihydrolipoamide acetyltransferase)